MWFCCEVSEQLTSEVNIQVNFSKKWVRKTCRGRILRISPHWERGEVYLKRRCTSMGGGMDLETSINQAQVQQTGKGGLKFWRPHLSMAPCTLHMWHVFAFEDGRPTYNTNRKWQLSSYTEALLLVPFKMNYHCSAMQLMNGFQTFFSYFRACLHHVWSQYPLSRIDNRHIGYCG